MKKDYQKPEVELIALTAQENVTSEVGDGEQDLVSSPF